MCLLLSKVIVILLNLSCLNYRMTPILVFFLSFFCRTQVYSKIDYIELLKRFEHHREYDYEHKKKVSNMKRKDKSGKEKVSVFKTKDWINYPNNFIFSEKATIDFLSSINAIKNTRR